MAADILIKFDGIEGESGLEKHTGWIECSSFSEAIFAPGSTELGGGSGVGKATFSDFSFTTVAGKHSIFLKQKCFEGKSYPKVEIHYMKQTATNTFEPYEIRTLENVFVTSYSCSKGNDMLASEAYSMQATKATWEYKIQNADMSLTSVGETSYDQKAGLTA
jgi:type VI secretion system secreted protein Hcp